MNINDAMLKMPTRLDEPVKLLFWDLDQALVALVFFFFGLLTKYVITFLCLGMFFAWAWMKFRSGKHPWFLMHGYFWYLPVAENSQTIPNSHHRHFLK